MTTTVVAHTGAVGGYYEGTSFDLTPTIIGSPPQWDDTSDATYAVAETTSDDHTSRPIASFAPIPPATEMTGLRITVRYSTNYPDGTLAAGPPRSIAYTLSTGTTPGASYEFPIFSQTTFGHPAIIDDDGIHEFTLDLGPFVALPFYQTGLASIFHGGGSIRFYAQNANSVGDPKKHAYLTVYKVLVELDVPGAPVVPVARLWPRDDGRGISSAARIYPRPKANRIVGGYR